MRCQDIELRLLFQTVSLQEYHMLDWRWKPIGLGFEAGPIHHAASVKAHYGLFVQWPKSSGPNEEVFEN